MFGLNHFIILLLLVHIIIIVLRRDTESEYSAIII